MQDPASLSFIPATTAAPDVASSPVFEEFEQGELVAVVGTEHILAGDVHVYMERIVEQYRKKLTSKAQEEMLREQIFRPVLTQYVRTKAMYQEFFRDMVGSKPPKEMLEVQEQVTTKAGKIFFEKQVPGMLERYEARDLPELESKLREKNMSLVTLKTQFIEQVLAGQVEQKYVPEEFEIDPAQIMEYYRAHRQEWEYPARARWREISVRFDKHPSRADAEQRIIQLGNEVYLGGNFEAVARQSSDGYTADQGGVYDWTSQGSLKSKPIDAALFSIEPGRLSQIIADDIGLHIVEVLEREPAGTRALIDSQSEIRKKLSDEKREVAVKELYDRVMARTPVWTRWPEDIPGSRPLSQALGNAVAE